MARNERILVVDDDPDALQLIATLLSGEGYVVERATDGPSGLAKAKAQLPDLVLLDIAMPGMDGLAVCDKLRFDPKTRDVPIIFLSAKGDGDTVALASVLDAYAFIRKPFKPEELLGEVRNCLNTFGRKKP